MSDIFHEVEEEVRRERFEELWKQYGDYIIAGVALIIIAIAGFELWQRYEANQRLKASETLIAAQQLAEAGDIGRAAPGFAALAQDAPGGYAKVAKLSQAATLLVAGQRGAAISIYQSIAAKDHGVIGDVALLRAAWAMADFTPRAQIEAMVSKLNGPKSPWRHVVQEILAYSDFHAGLLRQAQIEFKAIADDKDSPGPMRQRASAMAEFLARGGPANFGTVPAPEPAAPATDSGAPPAAPTNGKPQQ